MSTGCHCMNHYPQQLNRSALLPSLFMYGIKQHVLNQFTAVCKVVLHSLQGGYLKRNHAIGLCLEPWLPPWAHPLCPICPKQNIGKRRVSHNVAGLAIAATAPTRVQLYLPRRAKRGYTYNSAGHPVVNITSRPCRPCRYVSSRGALAWTIGAPAPLPRDARTPMQRQLGAKTDSDMEVGSRPGGGRNVYTALFRLHCPFQPTLQPWPLVPRRTL